jgi:hypothetical protein
MAKRLRYGDLSCCNDDIPALGGDGFLAFKKGKECTSSRRNNMSDVVIDYLKSGHKIVPAQINEMRVEAVK